MPSLSSWYVTNGIGEVSERKGVPVRARRRAAGLLEAVAPGAGVAGVVDLVHDHQRAALLGARPVQQRLHADLRVGQRDSDEPAGMAAVGVLEIGVDRQVHARGGIRPLPLEVLGGAHHGDPVDGPAVHELPGQAQRERRLAGAGRGHGHEVARLGGEVLLQGLCLPGAQLPRCAPGGALGVGGRHLGGRAAEQ